MALSPLAGKPAPAVPADRRRSASCGDYYERQPGPQRSAAARQLRHQRHRGTPLDGTFTEAHILAITQAICDYRRGQGSTGRCSWARTRMPLSGAGTAHGAGSAGGQWRGDVHPAGRRRHADAGHLARDPRCTTAAATAHLADGIVITPSHNPPEDGGFKYNPTNGGPADTDVTHWIQDRANALLRGGNRDVKRDAVSSRRSRPTTTHAAGLLLPYVDDLRQRHRYGRHSRRRAEARRRSARRGVAWLLGADRRALRSRSHGRESKASIRLSRS